MKTIVTESKIDSLIPDDLNANKGTEYGKHLMDKSFRELGAGRSILIDKNNRIIGGNKSVEQCAEIGLNDIIIVETDGTKLVAVKRTDIDLNTKQGREMALADNATSKANLAWDEVSIKQIENEWDIKPEDWGCKIPDYAAGSEHNSMTDEDVDILDDFDPIGNSSGLIRVVFIFDGPEEAESYLNNLQVKFKKRNMAWQVNMSTQSI